MGKGAYGVPLIPPRTDSPVRTTQENPAAKLTNCKRDGQRNLPPRETRLD
jgi:hypothetical protein